MAAEGSKVEKFKLSSPQALKPVRVHLPLSAIDMPQDQWVPPGNQWEGGVMYHGRDRIPSNFSKFVHNDRSVSTMMI